MTSSDHPQSFQLIVKHCGSNILKSITCITYDAISDEIEIICGLSFSQASRNFVTLYTRSFADRCHGHILLPRDAMQAGCMTLRTTPLKSELTICTTGEGVRWLWACQQRVRRSVRRTVTASAIPWTARSSNAHLSCCFKCHPVKGPRAGSKITFVLKLRRSPSTCMSQLNTFSL